MTQNELAAKLDTLGTQLAKVKTEVQALADAIADAPVNQAVTDALGRLQEAVDGVDAINPDAQA